MRLSTVFIGLIVICIVSLIFSIRARRVNHGYTMTTALLILCDVLIIFIVECSSIRSARNILFFYYMCFVWMFFGTAWTSLKIASVKNIKNYLIPFGIYALINSAVVICCFNTPRVLTFSKRILFGRMWWIVEGMKEPSSFINFSLLNVMFQISAVSVLMIMIICLLKTRNIFRGKMIGLMIIQIFLIVIEFLEFHLSLPIWIYTLIINFVCYIVFYLAFVHPDQKIRDEAIMSFANEMSDGLILYNELNDLIHVNNLIKNTMDRDFVEKIKDISFLEEWITHREYVENIDTIHYRNGEKEIYFTVKKYDLGLDKNASGVAYILHDTTNSITQIRLMEKVNSELERTSRMKSDFLANMSHELRTPMNAVIGMAEIALREGEMNPRIKDCLTQINHSGRNLLNIINDILDYSKIDAGKMEIIPDNYEPLSEVNDIANILQTRVGDKELELFFIVDPAIPHELFGDSMRIRQILINIANNAIKFTDKGRIKITLDCEKKNEDEIDLIYHISDTGHGIKPEDLEKLFVSFQQVDSKRNRNVEGTGLGLAISKSLCEAMGGTIGVNSEYGKGSDFWFRVPQKVIDPGTDLVVEDAAGKFAYAFNERQVMQDEFSLEMDKLGLECKVIPRFEDYVPTGKKDFIFIEENFYTKETEEFLDANPDLTPIILVRFGSGFKSTRKNMRILSRPLSTLAMVLVLNGKEISDMHFANADEDGETHFVAPDAKILVVDDNSINLSIALGLLEPLKVKCEVAQSGDEALEKIRRNRYDMILMDHMMPGMDGIETTQVIRETIPEAADVPILALTANVVEGSKEMFIKAGMVDMIAKPIEVKQLNQKISTWLPKEKVQQVSAFEIPDEDIPEEDTKDYVHYDCLDCEAAIKGLGKAALFEKIVKEYYKRGSKTLEEIQTAHGEKNWADYAIKTHALKSSSRQIGAFELGDLAEKLEHAGKAEDTITIGEFHEKTMNTFTDLLAALSEYFPEEEETEDKLLISNEEFESILKELETACDELAMDDMEACAEKLKKYIHPDSRKEALDSLYEAIENVDTDLCMEIIHESFAK